MLDSATFVICCSKNLASLKDFNLSLPIKTYKAEALGDVCATNADLQLNAALFHVPRHRDKKVKTRRINHLRGSDIEMQMLPLRIPALVLVENVQDPLPDRLNIRTEDITADYQGDFLT
jgi:hypothetical protein